MNKDWDRTGSSSSSLIAYSANDTHHCWLTYLLWSTLLSVPSRDLPCLCYPAVYISVLVIHEFPPAYFTIM